VRTTNTVLAFDMRIPAERAALANLLEPTPAQRAETRFAVACTKTDTFALRLTRDQQMALMMDRRTVPAGVMGDDAAQLANLLAAEDAARVVLKNGGEAPAYAMAAE
jgi:hypothetical protein